MELGGANFVLFAVRHLRFLVSEFVKHVSGNVFSWLRFQKTSIGQGALDARS